MKNKFSKPFEKEVTQRFEGWEKADVGRVVAIGDGIVRVAGVAGVRSGELLHVDTRTGVVSAMALNLEKDSVGAVVLGKDAEIAQWEAEIRKSLANKKASTTVTLTKQQQALVNTQLAKESEVRQRVTSIKTNLDRGLHFIGSIINASVPEFRVYISTVVTLLLDGALEKGSLLSGSMALATYLVSIMRRLVEKRC